MSKDVRLKVTLVNPPAGIDFGLQTGSGNNYEKMQIQRSGPHTNLTFQFTIAIKGEKSKDKFPKLSGPFVQGNAGDKFVYIDIGTAAGQTNTPWSRRLKIPLTGITWDIIEKIFTGDGLLLESHVPGTGKDGGPNCATVKPFDGWKIESG